MISILGRLTQLPLSGGSRGRLLFYFFLELSRGRKASYWVIN